MFRIMLVDDHPTMRVGLRALLEQDPTLTVVGEANSGEEALERIDEVRPDVIVLDCQLPQQSGVAVASALQRRGHPARVLALSAYDDKHYVRGMLAAGASGYLTKEEAPHKIVEAVRAVAQGEPWFSPAIQDALTPPSPHDPRVAPRPLTPRELEVLPHVVAGMSNAEIALELGISEKTVEKHLHAIFDELAATSRVEVATLAVQSGLLPVH